MLRAVSLAGQGKGKTRPNPCVGAVIVAGSEIVGQGFHRVYGGNHAEVEAINMALTQGYDLSSCTLFVTLEPCNHHGKTPPCTQAILDSGLKHVVVGARDPNRSVAGGGIEHLRSKGIKVTAGVEEQACLDLIADFMIWQTTSLPYLYLKMASTLDGRIATRFNHSRWVTCDASRRKVHQLRNVVQAVIIGGNTFYQDNPQLTCRGLNATVQPLAVVVTSRLPDPDCGLFLVKQTPGRTIFWTGHETASSVSARKLKDLGCTVTGLDACGSGLDLGQGLKILRNGFNIHYAMCEGGGRIGMSLLQAGLVHEIWHFAAMKILGDDQALPVFQGRAPQVMDEALEFRLGSVETIGTDVLLKLFPHMKD